MLLPKRVISAVVGLLVLISLLAFMRANVNHNTISSLAFMSSKEALPFINHLVLFRFKSGTSLTAIKEVTSKMLGLKKACKHPSTGMPYIRSISGGKDISIEDIQNGMSHVFVVQFFSTEDRDYYVGHDPVHHAFKKSIAPVIEKSQVVDFQEGVFT